MDELATVLRRERWLLNVLLFRLTEMRHLLAANDSRFLGWASAEVEEAVARVREAELIRNTLVSRLAREMEMPEDDLTLSSLSQGAPEPYRPLEMLRDGLDAQFAESASPTTDEAALCKGRVARRKASYAAAIATRSAWRDRIAATDATPVVRAAHYA